MCGSALLPRALSRGGLIILLSLATPAFAFEPMPPIMQTLLQVFPEEEGRFVDEPFGSTDQMPKEAKPLFETFRVVVPTVDDIEKNLARLFSASSYLKIRKITRYDRDPGAPGLPGFRGVWCQTENKDDVGFSIVTINQNRFLIWAKMGYYPAYGNDSINPKVRDQYARDVSQYLAGVDLKVPENEAPEAGGRGLPEWVGLYPSRSEPDYSFWDSFAREREIRSWGLSRLTGFAPTSELEQRILLDAPDTPLVIRFPDQLQEQLEILNAESFDVQPGPTSLHDQSQLSSRSYEFAIDRFGRIRIFGSAGEGDSGIPLTVLFPGLPIVCGGAFVFSAPREYIETSQIRHVSCASAVSTYTYAGAEDATPAEQSELHLRTLGHFISAAHRHGLSIGDVHIYKFPPHWVW